MYCLGLLDRPRIAVPTTGSRNEPRESADCARFPGVTTVMLWREPVVARSSAMRLMRPLRLPASRAISSSDSMEFREFGGGGGGLLVAQLQQPVQIHLSGLQRLGLGIGLGRFGGRCVAGFFKRFQSFGKSGSRRVDGRKNSP